jgi:hypothetical protein
MCNSFRFSFIIMLLKMAALCLDARLETLSHSIVAARSVSKGISAAAFTRDLLRLSRLL